MNDGHPLSVCENVSRFSENAMRINKQNDDNNNTNDIRACGSVRRVPTRMALMLGWSDRYFVRPCLICDSSIRVSSRLYLKKGAVLRRRCT